MTDAIFMNYALNEAKKAFSRGDVPIGAVIINSTGDILGKGSDEKNFDPTAHAEIKAIKTSAEKLKRWNLTGCTLYVTLEPCPMCAGACVNSRISRVVYGAKNFKSGAGGTLYNILSDLRLNHRCEIKSGVLEKECLKLLQDYFYFKRELKKLS